jgi:hypothetical protein
MSFDTQTKVAIYRRTARIARYRLSGLEAYRQPGILARHAL